jgi:hypothetical protein
VPITAEVERNGPRKVQSPTVVDAFRRLPATPQAPRSDQMNESTRVDWERGSKGRNPFMGRAPIPSQPVGFDRMDPTCSPCSEPRWNFCAICGGSLGTLASIEHRPRPRLSRWSRWPSARALGAESRLAGDGRHRDDAASPSAVAVVAERPESLSSSSPWWWRWPSSRAPAPRAHRADSLTRSRGGGGGAAGPALGAIEPRQPHPIALRWSRWPSSRASSRPRRCASSRCSRPLAVVERCEFPREHPSAGRSGGRPGR